MVTQDKIAICIPTFLKDDILMECINSILDNYEENWIILIGDQNKPEDDSLEKQIFYNTACSKAHTYLKETDRIKIHRLPYDCGLSYARNELVYLANDLGIKYCLMTADSIKFTDKVKYINNLIHYLNYSEEFNLDLIGLELEGRISWEAWMDMQNCFVLDFIEKNDIESSFDNLFPENFIIWRCDIVRNFFLATTESLLNVKWDINGKMSEHCPWFWEYKQAGYQVGWTDAINGKYIKNNDTIYREKRAKNLVEGKKYYMNKYHLKTWSKYINHQNIRHNQC